MPSSSPPDSPLTFAPERPATRPSGPPWRILVVDDEEQVHAVTRLVADDMTHEGRPLQVLSAFSAAEARRVLRETDDVAVILLDVVMETADAGLALVHDIRVAMGLEAVRIILRTGQPGYAPERTVITDYDINDYKAKNDLTADRLFTALVAALRGYGDIRRVQRYRQQVLTLMHQQDDLLRQVVAALPVPVALVDDCQVVVACNTAFAAAVGASWEAVFGERLEDVAPALALDDTAFAAFRADGHPRAVPGGRVVPYATAEGGPSGAILILADGENRA